MRVYERVGATIITASTLAMGSQAISYADTPTPKPQPRSLEIIDVSRLPDKLPADVQQQIPNVAAIISLDGNREKNSKQINAQEGLCSGVRVGVNEYLSAGHCIHFDPPKATEVPYCAGTSVFLPIDNQDGIRLRGINRAAEVPSIGKGDTLLNEGQPDELLIQTNPNDPANQPAYTNPTVFHNPIDKIEQGQELYFINYEPTTSGATRNPLSKDLNKLGLKEGPQTPAIIGGLALEYLNNGTLDVLLTGKSYGNPVDGYIRPGASGGPVYDSNGHLVATTTSVSPEISLNSFENDTDILVPELSPDTKVEVVQIKIASQDIVNGLSAHGQNLPPRQCIDTIAR